MLRCSLESELSRLAFFISNDCFMTTDLATIITTLVTPILSDLGIELVELEFKREGQGQLLRLFIDKPGGVTLDDCIAVSREVSATLDVEDPITSPYRLEVSSPGIDRPLKKPSDFARFAGETVKLKSRELLDPDGRGHRRKTFVGELLGLDGSQVRLRLTDKRGGEISIKLDDIEKANLQPTF
jgi:ribosome maturation factor RimP